MDCRTYPTDPVSLPTAVRRLGRDAHRLLKPGSGASLCDLDRTLDQVRALRAQATQPNQADLALWTERLGRQIEARRSQMLTQGVSLPDAPTDFARAGMAAV